MRLAILIAIAAVAAIGADDPWLKVRKTDTGSELRIIRRGESKPVIATFDDATDDSLIVVVKNEEIAIPKDQILRIDARPAKSGPRMTKTTTESTADPQPTAKPQEEKLGPTSSSSTSYTVADRPDFVTIYRRTASMPQKESHPAEPAK